MPFELGCSSSGHVGPVAETISGEQDVGNTSRCDRNMIEVMDANANAGPFWQGHRQDGPTDRQA